VLRYHLPSGWRHGLLAGGLFLVVLYHGVLAPQVRRGLPPEKQAMHNLRVVLDAPFGRTYTTRKFAVDQSRQGAVRDLRILGAKLGFTEPPEKRTRRRTFWNARLVLAPYLAALMAVTFALAWLPFWRRARQRLRWLASPLLLMGRWALRIYVFHLAVIAIGVVIWGRAKLSIPAWAGFTLGVLVLSLGFAGASDWWRRRRGHDLGRKPMR